MKDGSKVLFKYHQLKSTIAKELDWSDINVVIFVSTGRTGTHFMSHFFNNNFEKSFGIHEPDINIYDLNINYLKGKIQHNQTIKMLDMFRKEVHETIREKGAQNYIESNLELSFLIPVLKKYFPKFKVVHVVRNAKDVVRSYYSREAYGKWVGWVPFMSEKDPRDRLNARIFPEDPYFEKWNSLDRFSKICWYWSKYNNIIDKYLSKEVDSIRVTFEDLFKKQNLSVWNQMIDFCELSDFQKNDLDIIQYLQQSRSNEVKTFKIGKYPEWTEEQKSIFKETCGDTMKRFGYEI